MNKSKGNSLFKSNNANKDEGEHWLTVSDLMAGLMIVFLFIAIAYMRDTKIENKKMKEVAIAYQTNQVAIYDSLMEEFQSDLAKWGAKINQETISFEFNAPEVLFIQNEITLRPRFKEILNDFFPRYLNRLLLFRDSINEIRIEGHTSSEWNKYTDKSESYFENMELSQGRTRSVLKHVYYLPDVNQDQKWIKKTIAAVGFSSSKLIVKDNGEEDKNASRRVSFRVITNAEVQIRKILEE